MLFQEWNMNDALAVRFEEGHNEGMERGREETARNAIAQGLAPELVHRITGLDMETIQRLDSAKN